MSFPTISNVPDSIVVSVRAWVKLELKLRFKVKDRIEVAVRNISSDNLGPES